ncbi:MAG: DUF4886 domain-containing protein, partial [Prevotellaceae bacterium]|nr:DUF4886 domain-containing protein [Prevotellaceae bacterium]
MRKYWKIVLTSIFFTACITLLNAQATIRILAIGNSFSVDAVEQYLYELGTDEGIDLIIGNMHIGGCSLERHLNNANNNTADYAYRKIVNGVKTSLKNTTLEYAIADEPWDYI